MESNLGLLKNNIALLRTSASRHAYLGTFIALLAVLCATGLTAWIAEGQITLSSLWRAQHQNAALWLLDAMPFVFALWGQYFSVVIAHEAGALMVDQTEDLRADKAALEVKAHQRSHLDRLTGLPNRDLFLDRTEQAIQRAHADNHSVGLLVLDIDKFSEINQALGQQSGDRVLQSVGKRLRSVIEEPATVARLGADSFAMLLPRIADSHAIIRAARSVSRALEPALPMQNVSLTVSASVGASMCPDHALDAETLLTNADLAMHEAKTGRSKFVLFKNDDARSTDPAKLSLVAELRQAIDLDLLELYVQPIVNYANQELASVEALLRWTHPRRGVIPPSEFIPKAERSGLINPLTYWVLKRALMLSQDMASKGDAVNISVNISASTLLDPDFPDTLTGLLAAHDVSASSLTLEITEDTLMSDQRGIQDIFARLAASGLRFSIDDFGTGYSQLAYLKRLPVSEVKIDQSFIKDMLASRVDASIVEATINLAHALDLRVVAEGVEDGDQAQRLTELECDFLQGYYVARPMPTADFPAWLAAWQNAPDELIESERAPQPLN